MWRRRGRLAQRESACFTRKRSLVQSQRRPPINPAPPALRASTDHLLELAAVTGERLPPNSIGPPPTGGNRDQAGVVQPAKVMKLVQKKGSRWKLTPDMRLHYTFDDREKSDRLAAARERLKEVVECLV